MAVSLNGVDSGLTGSGEQSRIAASHSHHVPGRNMIFVGLAMSLAESVGATKIWYGANYERPPQPVSDLHAAMGLCDGQGNLACRQLSDRAAGSAVGYAQRH